MKACWTTKGDLMLKGVLSMLVKGWARDLALRPQNLILNVCLKHPETGDWARRTIANIDAVTVAKAFRTPAAARLLEIQLGDNTVVRINLGASL